MCKSPNSIAQDATEAAHDGRINRAPITGDILTVERPVGIVISRLGPYDGLGRPDCVDDTCFWYENSVLPIRIWQRPEMGKVNFLVDFRFLGNDIDRPTTAVTPGVGAILAGGVPWPGVRWGFQYYPDDGRLSHVQAGNTSFTVAHNGNMILDPVPIPRPPATVAAVPSFESQAPPTVEPQPPPVLETNTAAAQQPNPLDRGQMPLGMAVVRPMGPQPGPRNFSVNIGATLLYPLGKWAADTMVTFARNCSNAINEAAKNACDEQYRKDIEFCTERVRKDYSPEEMYLPPPAGAAGARYRNAQAILKQCNAAARRQYTRCLDGKARDPADEWNVPDTTTSLEKQCELGLQYDDALCEAYVLPQYGPSGLAICKQSATQRYAECKRNGGRAHINTPLAGVDTPL